MPTYSPTSDFNLSIDDISEEAFERCGLQIRSGYDIKTARRSLNLMLAEWANRGLNLWTIQQTNKTLTRNCQNDNTFISHGRIRRLEMSIESSLNERACTNTLSTIKWQHWKHHGPI